MATLSALLAALAFAAVPELQASAAASAPRSPDVPPALARALAEVFAEARARRLAEARPWRTLLHYERSWLGVDRSTVDSDDFFLSTRGKTDPEAELEATLRALFAPPVDESTVTDLVRGQHAGCRFQARRAWLDAELGLTARGLPTPSCPAFESWSSTLRAASVTVVFASAYLANPASMFGHTLLRLDRPRRSHARDLLAYAVNFSAEPTTWNPLFYALLGLMGGFDGRFSTVPYYLKVKEYGDFENRDLWEYPLQLSPSELERLLRHLWEIGPSTLDYFYFDENCSYQLLKVLEAAAPRLHLTDELRGFVIPSDTLRALLTAPGLVGAPEYRPSRHTVMVARRARLSEPERLAAFALARKDDTPLTLESLAPERRRAVLDTAAELVAYRRRSRPEEQARVERRILTERTRLRLGPDDPEIPAPSPPEAGHATSLVAVGAGHSGGGAAGQSYMALTLRPALHDLLAAQDGYAETSEIELGRVEVRAPLERGPIRLERVDLVRIVALSALDGWAPRLSWRIDAAIARPIRRGHLDRRSLGAGLSGGPGLTLRLPELLSGVAYLFADADLEAGAVFEHDVRVRAGATFGLVAEPVRGFRARLEAGYAFPFVGEGPRRRWVDGGVRLSGAGAIALAQDLELRLPVVYDSGLLEGSLAVLFYF